MGKYTLGCCTGTSDALVHMRMLRRDNSEQSGTSRVPFCRCARGARSALETKSLHGAVTWVTVPYRRMVPNVLWWGKQCLCRSDSLEFVM